MEIRIKDKHYTPLASLTNNKADAWALYNWLWRRKHLLEQSVKIGNRHYLPPTVVEEIKKEWR